MIGVNLTSAGQINKFIPMIESRNIDYIEILIDNFLYCDPYSVLDTFNNIPVAFHIMRSRFLERDYQELVQIAKKISMFINIIKPIYVSDHLAEFFLDNLPLPKNNELKYDEDKADIFKKVKIWQDLLDSEILFENYPSLTNRGKSQPEFLYHLVKETSCGILFDISNAFIATKNLQLPASCWNPVLELSRNFHVGGYSVLEGSDLLLDSHDQRISNGSKKYIKSISDANFPINTITVEYDHNINYDLWCDDIKEIQGILFGGSYE